MTDSSTTAAKTAIVLFGHGSRDPQWKKPIEAVASRMRALSPDVLVTCAYLEMTTPDLPTVVSQLSESGVTRIDVLPMFLGVGRHAREDLPEIVESLSQNYSSIRFDLRPSIGEQAAVVDLLARIALE